MIDGDNPERTDSDSPSRRTVLAALGSLSLTGGAGCLRLSSESDGTSTPAPTAGQGATAEAPTARATERPADTPRPTARANTTAPEETVPEETPIPGEETPTPVPDEETPTPVPGEETPTPVPTSGWPADVNQFEWENLYTITGDLAEGQDVSIEWADTAGMACWVGTKNRQFDGYHVFFGSASPLEPGLTRGFRVLPYGDVNYAIYAYLLEPNRYVTPPDVRNAIECESSPARSDPGRIEEVQITNDYGEPLNVFVGVASEIGYNEGRFDFKVDTSY